MKLLLLLSLLCLSPLQYAAEEQYLHTESRFRFPASLGEFSRDDVHRYPDQRLGVMVGYSAPGIGAIGFYLFDYGLSPIPDGPDSDVVLRAFLSSDRDIRTLQERGEYSDLIVKSAPGATVQVRPRTPRFRVIAYEYQPKSKSEPVVSWLFVTGAHQHFLKIRYTCPASRAKEGQRAFENLLVAFFAANGT